MIGYIIGIVAVVLVTAVCVLAGVYLGLKWRFQVEVKGEAPTVELPEIRNPLAVILERRREDSLADNILDEYLNGERKVE